MDLIGSILDNIEEALIITDPESRVLYFNKIAESISNATLTRPLKEGVKVEDIVSEERKEIVRNIYKKIREDRTFTKSFAEYRNKNGEIVYLEFKYVPVNDDNGVLTHIHTFFRDVTPQKVFEKKLTTEITNIRNFIDKANAIIIGIDSRGYITDWNRHCTHVTGYDKNEVYAQKFSQVLLQQEERHLFDELVTNVMSNEAFINYELHVVTKRGRVVTLLLSNTIRTSASGAPIGIIFVGQDVTELMAYRKSLEQQVEERTHELQQALMKEKEVVEMKSRFISVASHEFRTPLSSIEYATGFIKKNNTNIEPQEVEKKLSSIEKQVKHMKHLLDDVLMYSKSEAGKIQLLKNTFRAEDFLYGIVEEVSVNTRNTHKIDLRMANLPEYLQTDEKLLRNILINLLTNAIKFSPGKETIEFDVEVKGGLVFRVRDYGIGIAEEELSMIFDPFVRSNAVASIQGTGLGLSIVSKAVELLKGTINVESKVGSGTTFSVTIPI